MDRFVERIFLIFTTYIFLVCCYVELLTARHDSYGLLFCTILFGVMVSSYFASLKLSHQRVDFSPIKPKDYTILFLMGLLYSVTRWPEINSGGIWLDEYTQFMRTFQSLDTQSPATSAAIEQQPPIDYYLSAFSAKIIGFSEWSVRFHTLLSSFIFSVIIYPIATLVGGRREGGIFAGLVFTSFPFFIFHSVEARPLFLCLLFGLFSLYFFFQYLRGNKNYYLLKLFVAQSFFVFSAGFQPEVFILVLAICSSLIAFQKTLRPIYLKTILVHFATLVVFSPVLFKIIDASIPLNQFHPDTHDRFVSKVTSLSFEAHLQFFRIMGGYSYLLFALVIIWGGLHGLVKHKTQPSQTNAHIKVGLVFLILFPPIFNLIFETSINWSLFPRYYIVGYLILLVLVAQICSVIITVLPNSKSKWAGSIALLTGIILAHNSNHTHPFSEFTKPIRRQDRIDWRGVYGTLSKKLKSNDRVYHFNLHDIGNWRPNVFVAKELYIDKSHWDKFIRGTHYYGSYHAQSQLGKDIASGKTKGKVYLLLENLRNKEEIFNYILEPSPFYQLHSEKQMLLLEFPNDDGKSVIKFLKSLQEKYSLASETSMVYEVLLDWSFFSNQINESRKFLRNFRKVSIEKGPSRDGSEIFKLKILKDKLKFFENLISNTDAAHPF